MGESTRSEVRYAIRLGKPVRFLEPVPLNWEDEYQEGAPAHA